MRKTSSHPGSTQTSTQPPRRRPQRVALDVVERAQEGDRAAMRTLFDAYRDDVMAYCLLSTHHDRELALDLTQDIFVKVFRALPKLRKPERFRSWLFTITANACRSRARDSARYRDVLASFLLQFDATPDLQDKAAREARILAVRRALEGISDDVMRRIAMLKYTDPEHTTREIAAKLGIPHGTVTVKLMRFRARFKDVLQAAIEELDGELPYV